MTLRAYLIELVGTFLLVLFSAGTVCVAKMEAAKQLPVGLVAIAVVQGAALAVILTVTTPVSEGCVNPAITLALWVTKRFDGARAFALILVQLIGAAFAGALLVLIFDQHTLEEAYTGTPHLRAFLDEGGKTTTGDWLIGAVVEAVLTFLLTLALLTAMLDPRRQKHGPLIAGLALTAVVLLGYHLTGAAANPARWLGTAIWQKTVPTLETQPVFRDHLPYWMGPIVGALLAAIVYAEWLRPDTKKG